MEIKSHKGIQTFPPFGIWMGAPKVGKSTFMASIDNCLIVDLESTGYNHIDVEHVTICESINELHKICEFYFDKDNKYNVLVLDHLREITLMYSKEISQQLAVEYIDDASWAKGTRRLTNKLLRFMKYLSKKSHENRRVYLIAHAVDRSGEVRLDVDGKNDSMVLGLVDFVGYLYKSGPTLMVNFSQATGAEYGCRNKNLGGYNDVADYNKILAVASQ